MKEKRKFLSPVQLFATPWTVQSMEFSKARILEWVAFPFSRASSQPRDRTHVDSLPAEPQGNERKVCLIFSLFLRKNLLMEVSLWLILSLCVTFLILKLKKEWFSVQLSPQTSFTRWHYSHTVWPHIRLILISFTDIAGIFFVRTREAHTGPGWIKKENKLWLAETFLVKMPNLTRLDTT